MRHIRQSLCILIIAFAAWPAFAHPSYGIAVDSDGNIYFADLFHNERGSVWKLSSKGELTLLLGNFHAHNLGLDASGNLYVSHGEGTHTMVRRNMNGRIDTIINTTDIREFFGGNAIYRNGMTYFQIDKQVWTIDEDGNKKKYADHRFDWNQSLFVDSDGNIFGPDLGKGEGYGEVIRLSTNGSSKIVVEDLLTILDRGYDPHQDVLLGIGQDDQGFLYIAETAGRRIIKFKEDGYKDDFYVTEAPWFPTGITFHNGSAYILEYKSDHGYGGPRITKITDGESEVIFNYDSHVNPIKPTEKESGGFPGWAIGLMMAGALLVFTSIFLILRGKRKQMAG